MNRGLTAERCPRRNGFDSSQRGGMFQKVSGFASTNESPLEDILPWLTDGGAGLEAPGIEQ